MKTMLMTLALGACLAGFAGTNLLERGDFEMPSLKGWGNWEGRYGRIGLSTESPHAGAKCLTYTHRDVKGQGIAVCNVPVRSGATYTVSGWIRGSGSSLAVRVFWFDVKGKYLSATTVFSAVQIEAWQHFEKAVTVPENVDRLQFGVAVANGTGYFDDLRVEEGNLVREYPNVIPNSGFGYRLHKDGMPEFWNAGGGFSFELFQPGVHEGRFFHPAPEEKTPVAGAKAIYVSQVARTQFACGALVGGTDYTFSIWARSDEPGAKLKLLAPFLTPKEESFSLTNVWRRYSFTGYLKDSVAQCYPTIDYGRHAMFLAAPMLHEGKTALPWKPSPEDANLIDLMAGTQKASRNEVLTLTVPETADDAAAATCDQFVTLKEKTPVSGRCRAAVRQEKGVLHVAVDCTSTPKPAVAPTAGKPLVMGNDAAELFVSPKETGAGFVQFMGGRNGAFAATRGSQGKAVNEGWSYSAAEMPTGWRATFAIPFALVGAPDGVCWRFNVGVTDFAPDGRSHFTIGRNGFSATETFVRLTGLPTGRRMSPPRVRVEHDYYTTEATARVKTFDVPAGAELTLVGADGKAVSATKTAADGAATFALGALADGYYEVTLQTANGSAKSHFRKSTAATHYSSVNRFTNLIEKDGKPFFPMVFPWGNHLGKLPTAWEIAELKSHNFNTILIRTILFAPWCPKSTPEFRREVMRVFTDAGFKFIVWTDCDKALKEGGMKGLVEARKRHIAEFDDFKDNILGWYFVDEIGPSWETRFGIKDEDYAWGYRELKACDPARFQFINWNWTGLNEGSKFYVEDGASDFYSIDCYPYTQDRGYGALAIHERASSILQERIADTGLPGIVWLQTYNYHEGIREPMPVEYRNNVFISLIYHTSGFMHFTGGVQNKDLWDEMGVSYGAALKWLDMTAQPGSECLARGKQGSISYALWKNGRGGYALVAANTLYAKQQEMIDAGRAALPRGRNGHAGARPSQTQDIELVGGEGELKIGEDGTLDLALPTAGSAAWFIK